MSRRLTTAVCAGALLLLLLLCACGGRTEEVPVGIQVYFVDDATGEYAGLGSALQGEAYDLEHPETVPTVEQLLDALRSGPREEELRSPVPGQVELLSWSLEEGLLRLDLSEDYGDLSGVELTLADYCITLTMCQLEGVETVEITAGHSLSYRSHRTFTPEEVFTSGALEQGA